MEIGLVKTRKDADRISRIVLSTVLDDTEDAGFNPFPDRIFRSRDGTIRLMGKELQRDEAQRELAEHVWEHRRKVNRDIRKREIVGPMVVDCGC